MQTEDLIWFVQVAKVGSISAAATSLGVSQPTLSKAMARLERSTRTRLLERQARGVRLTPYGLIMQQHAQRLELNLSDMMAELRDMRQGKGGLLRWGIGVGVSNALVVPACQAMHADGIRLDIAGGMTDVLMQDLLQGRLDLLLIGSSGRVAPPIKWQRLCSDPMRIFAPVSHPLAKIAQPSMAQLAQAQWMLPGPQTFTRQDVNLSFLRAGFSAPEPLVSSRSSQRDLVLAQQLGLLLTLPESLAVAPELKHDFVQLRAPTAWISRRELGFAWRGEGYNNPLIKRCIKLVQQAHKSLP